MYLTTRVFSVPLRLVFLGVGGWISNPRLGHTSILVVSSKRRAILLDAGEGVSKSLYDQGFRIGDLDAVIVTHMHGDHVLGLPTLVMLAKNYEKSKLKVVVHSAHLDNTKRLLDLVGVDYEGVLDILNVKPGQVVYIGEFKLTFEETCHTQPTIAIRVETEEACIVYSSDTAPCESIVEFSRTCRVLVHEASGYDPSAHFYGHSTVDDAIDIAERAGVEKLIIVHYYLEKPPIRTQRPLRVNVYLAHPGEEIVV
jgi:ribonuclease Z